jgi:hypothetical protein
MLILVSRTSIRPFIFTANKVPSNIEILVRTGTILPWKKPSKSEKGLQDISSRNEYSRPLLLAPSLQNPDLKQFEPDLATISESEADGENPTKEWIQGLNSLGEGTVEMSPELVQIREVKSVKWKDLRNIALFRFHCGIL